MAKGPINVTLSGRGPLTLRDTDYVAAGGEGMVYRAKATIIKIYSDPQKMLRDGMADKVKLLADRLHHHNIVAPKGIVSNETGAPIGFYMPFVDGEPMSRVFVSDFRMRTGFTDKHAAILVDRMREVVSAAHAAQCVMVDANELNWLVQTDRLNGHSPKVIDVDSWAVGRWPATVVMPSIRDWNAKTFDASSDWFGWGILAFQVFTGIHPYKGKADGYRPGDLIKRMKDGVSVFDPRVRMPHSVRDFSCIPGPLLDWFQAEFQDGARSIPPSPWDASKPAKAAKVLRAVTTATGSLLFERLYSDVDPVIRVWENGAALRKSGDLIDLATKKVLLRDVDPSSEVVWTPEGWVVAEMRGGDGFVRHVDGGTETIIPWIITTRRFFAAGDRLFAISDRELMELKLRVLGGRPHLTPLRRWTMHVQSKSWFDGVAVQDVLGATFLFIPVATGAVQVRVKELDDITVVSGFAAGRFAAFIGLQKDGTYRKVELYFDDAHRTYSVWSGGADSADLNAAMLPSGVVATIVDDGELILYVPANGKISKIADKQITTALRLTAWQDRLIYIDGGNVWRVRTKP